MPLKPRALELVNATIEPRPLGVVRAVVGLSAVLKTIELAVFLPDEGAFSGNLLGIDVGVSIRLWPVVVAMWLCAAVALTIGAWSRPAAAGLGVLTLGLIAFSNSYSNHLYLIGTLALLLSLTGCGAAFSVDSRRGDTPAEVPKWPVLLIQTQISAVYLFSAIGKVNTDFLSGNVLFHAVQDSMFLPKIGLLSNVPLLIVASVAAVVVELFLAVGLWFPRLQRLCLALGLGLHLAMVVAISKGPQTVFRLGVFAMLMLACYPLFRPVTLDYFTRAIRQRAVLRTGTPQHQY